MPHASRLAVRILAILVGLSLLGAAYESSSEGADARTYPPLVGGVEQLGSAGRGPDYPGVHVRSSGYGFSDAGPLPRTAERFAEELHTLLDTAASPGPYVLGSDSCGCWRDHSV